MGAASSEDRVSGELGVDRAEWLAGLIEHSTDVISILDLEGRLLYLNRTRVAASPADAIGKYVSEYLPSPAREAWESALRRAVETCTAQHLELPSYGGIFWEVRLVPIRRGDSVAYLVSIGSDVTEKKRTQSELANKQALLDLALNAAHMGQWVWEIAADRMIWDDTTRQMLEWSSADEAVSLEQFLARVREEDRARVRLHLQQGAQLGQLHPIEFRLVTQNGSERWLHWTGKAHLDDVGKARDLLGGVLDVTHQRQSEAALNRAQKLEALSQLAAGVAHDFNNLLFAILGSVQMAQIAKTPSEQKALLNEAVGTCLRAGELTRRLLAFGSNQGTGEQSINLGELVQNTLQLLGRLIPSSIEVKLDLAENLPAVWGDRGQIEQVVMNLCLNARDAMPKGGELSVSTRRVPLGSEPPRSSAQGRVQRRDSEPPSVVGPPSSRHAHYVVLTVKDNGAGIPPEMMSRIFEPFFTTKAQGTGLGLPTVHSIVQQHGGCIDVQSEPGGGATFSVYLPTA